MKKVIAFIPNLLTLCNLICGLCAIYFAFTSLISYAFWAIVVAAVFDFCDGFAARLLGAYSDLGKQLDSLSDIVSFGVAPSIVMINSVLLHSDPQWWWVAFCGGFLALFAALRLAKFNIDTRQSTEFRGLAVPAMALFVISFAVDYVPLLAGGVGLSVVAVVVTALLSWLMVSDIIMFSFKFSSYSLSDNIVRYVFALASVIIVVFVGFYAAPALIVLLYVVVSVVSAAIKWR